MTPFRLPDLVMLAPAALAVAQGAAVALYALAQAGLLLYAGHRWVVVVRYLRGRPAPPAPGPAPGRRGEAADEAAPRVTVQLPVYDERAVVERLIDAAAALDWPRDRLEIQVLDDSTDETRSLAAAAVARHRAAGLDVRHVTRATRSGYKAGALAHGLALARGELVAVFDADFVPPRDFLRRLVPAFDDPRVGMAQARWGHLNRDRSALTAAQAVLLDAHFRLEHRTRADGGLFFNFNGTAGIWRRACIEDAGGWSADTVTEDLDLSYRAQLRGWRFAYDESLEVPAELPVHVGALKSQQRRWAKGSMQAARKLLPAVWRSGWPLRVRLEAFFHLTGNAAYPLLLALTLLLAPVLIGPAGLAPWAAWALPALVTVAGLAPIALALALARARAPGVPARVARDAGLGLLLGAGLAWNNGLAVIEGLRGGAGAWERTPKTGDRAGAPAAARAYGAARAREGAAEAALALYALGLAALAAASGEARAVPFAAWLAAGFAFVAGPHFAERRRAGGGAPALTAGRSSSTAVP